MSDILASLFVDPIEIRGIGRIAMLVPLSLSISIIYKTIRCSKLASIPLASITLCGMIVFTMLMIGVVLLVVSNVLS